MPEFIEREALLNEAKKRAKAFSSALIYEAIKEAPAADVVEVVRCKDCKKSFRRQKEPSKLNFYWCNKWNTVVRECDFCSFGERQGTDD